MIMKDLKTIGEDENDDYDDVIMMIIIMQNKFVKLFFSVGIL